MFVGSFELEAAEDICDIDLGPDEFLDLLSSLVDKSILIRTEHNGVVRFRMLETLRDYGRDQIGQTDRYPELRRRHADWYRRRANTTCTSGQFSAAFADHPPTELPSPAAIIAIAAAIRALVFNGVLPRRRTMWTRFPTGWGAPNLNLRMT